MNEVNGMFGQQGWICPKCGRVFSPFTMMCPYCKKEETSNLPNNIPPSSNVPTSKETINMLTEKDYCDETIHE